MVNPFYKKLEEIKKLLLSQKEVLNVEELAIYTTWSKSYIYKLTMAGIIPHYKPNEGAKLLFFKKSEIEAYMTAYKVPTQEELDQQAHNYITIKNRKNDKY
jgi:excisionase family DNA binding protein